MKYIIFIIIIVFNYNLKSQIVNDFELKVEPIFLLYGDIRISSEFLFNYNFSLETAFRYSSFSPDLPNSDPYSKFNSIAMVRYYGYSLGLFLNYENEKLENKLTEENIIMNENYQYIALGLFGSKKWIYKRFTLAFDFGFGRKLITNYYNDNVNVSTGELTDDSSLNILSKLSFGYRF